MTSVPEISVVRAPVPVDAAPEDGSGSPGVGVWAPLELPPAARPSPTWLVVLALLAGLGAMVLGALAVVAATRSADEGAPATGAIVEPTAGADVERRVLALLAKPSTERVVFSGSGGKLVLAVGSGGRAAILARGLERAQAGWPYRAWVVGSGGLIRAASFTGAERAVLLSVPVARGQSVVVATDRAAASSTAPGRIIATRR